MAWVALDRMVKAIEQLGREGPLERWRKLRDAIHDEVCTKGFDTSRNAFVQYYGGKELDASLLMIPLVGFLPATDARMCSTVEALERELMADGFIRRYTPAPAVDGLPAGEGAFLACSFWLADAYVLMGRQADARAMFERLVGLCNDVGLLAEEYDVDAGEMVGNFPQAFSHVGLINTALNLSRTKGPAMERAADGHGVGSAPPRKI
jgi:GH15 family glucan-1,4-alpha-glucosidase